MKRRVLVLLGGISREREVSLVSGRAVADALKTCGHDVEIHDVTRDIAALLRALERKPDVVFNALHGRYGEDGCIQGLLELVGIPYTHSGVRASAIAMDKPATKIAVEQIGIRTPRGRVVPRSAFAVGDPMPRPFIVKPVAEGSTIGVSVVGAGSNTDWAREDWPYGDTALVEEYIAGHELTVGVMGERALAVTEIRFKGAEFDYTAKYTPGHAEHIVPAPLPRAVYDAAMDAALATHRALGCSGISRSDFRWDENRAGTEGLYFLEINTQPGFTPLSLVPEQAKHLGIAFGELCDWLVENARCHA
jgi:D-alanine-D-alanine ligase